MNEIIKIKDVEYYLIEKDKIQLKILDFYNIIGIINLKLIDGKWQMYDEKGFNNLLKYPENNKCKMVRRMDYKEAIDFYTMNDEFHTRLSDVFYYKAKKIIDCMSLDYDILLNETPQSPVLFKVKVGDNQGDWGILVSPILVDENSTDPKPIGVKQ